MSSLLGILFLSLFGLLCGNSPKTTVFLTRTQDLAEEEWCRGTCLQAYSRGIHYHLPLQNPPLLLPRQCPRRRLPRPCQLWLPSRRQAVVVLSRRQRYHGFPRLLLGMVVSEDLFSVDLTEALKEGITIASLAVEDLEEIMGEALGKQRWQIWR
ncbi:hypothetical protein DFS33DRAFT_769051 [Desarmillaria ectypa]|nr:hypothetical protein DFS33DRAFT_769051 [Desarmillaria ectypa]